MYCYCSVIKKMPQAFKLDNWQTQFNKFALDIAFSRHNCNAK